MRNASNSPPPRPLLLRDHCLCGAQPYFVCLASLSILLPSVPVPHITRRDCGFVYLDSFFDPVLIEKWKLSYNKFLASKEAQDFRYPCQGAGRSESMPPFREPFNSTEIYGDPRLRGTWHALSGDLHVYTCMYTDMRRRRPAARSDWLTLSCMRHRRRPRACFWRLLQA